MALSTLSSLNGNYKTKRKPKITFNNRSFFNPDITTTNSTTNLYATSTESTDVMPQWTVYGNINLSDGQVADSNNRVAPSIDITQAIILDATASFPLSYIQQLMYLPAGDYIVSLSEIIYDNASYAPANSYIKISFGSTVILNNYIATNYSDWSQLNFLINIPSDITDYFKIEAVYSTINGVRISIVDLNLTTLTMSPVSGFLLNEDFATPDIVLGGSNPIYIDGTTESSSSIISSWFLKGSIRINDGLLATFTGSETYIPSATNQYIYFIVTFSIPISYIRQPINLTVGTYMVSLFYILFPNDTVGAANFQVLFNDIQIGAITTIDNKFWTYYSFTFDVSIDTTGDFKIQHNYIDSTKRIAICNLKLRKIA